jgi:hypothetical protein
MASLLPTGAFSACCARSQHCAVCSSGARRPCSRSDLEAEHVHVGVIPGDSDDATGGRSPRRGKDAVDDASELRRIDPVSSATSRVAVSPEFAGLWLPVTDCQYRNFARSSNSTSRAGVRMMISVETGTLNR